ncbi:hypothetical protein ACJRO7_024426 [Eucalyptus globulus]|uniref:Transmembrane protein n=1 Tax=Eucalyptus globulus TaxID=34317 RepID=A0ABD3KCA0_EUCGL
MEKSESHGDARGKASHVSEEAKTRTAAAGTEAGFSAKRGGVIPAKRRLVKRMMWDRVVNWVCFALGSCFCSSATCAEPVRAKKKKKKTVGVAQVLPVPGEHQRC